MLRTREYRACCDRCASMTGTDAARMGRRQLLRDAVLHPQAEPDSPASPPEGLGHSGPAASPPAPAAGGSGNGQAAVGFPDADLLPRAVTGTVLDVSPQVLVIGDPRGEPGTERRVTLTGAATTWRGAPAEATAVRRGDRAIVRLLAGRRGIADRIWANIGRVTGTIIEHTSDFMVVDEGATRRRQIVVIPPRAVGRIQVRFPTLQPGYLIDVIGLRRADALEGLIPATSQPAYPASRPPEPPLISGGLPAAISGSATWHEPGGEPPGTLGVCYPALDPDAGCLEEAAPGRGRGVTRMPYLAVGSTLLVRNDCSGSSCVLPVTGCAAVARLFNDRCVTCGTSPRGRVADLTEASFVALGGELEQACFSATIAIGH